VRRARTDLGIVLGRDTIAACALNDCRAWASRPVPDYCRHWRRLKEQNTSWSGIGSGLIPFLAT